MKKIFAFLSALIMSHPLLFAKAPHDERIQKETERDQRTGLYRIQGEGSQSNTEYFYADRDMRSYGSSSAFEPKFLLWIAEEDKNQRTAQLVFAFNPAKIVFSSDANEVTFNYTLRGRQFSKRFGLESTNFTEYERFMSGKGQLAYDLSEIASADQVSYTVAGDKTYTLSQKDKAYLADMASIYYYYFNTTPIVPPAPVHTERPRPQRPHRPGQPTVQPPVQQDPVYLPPQPSSGNGHFSLNISIGGFSE